jgi:hypothetical protein
MGKAGVLPDCADCSLAGEDGWLPRSRTWRWERVASVTNPRENNLDADEVMNEWPFQDPPNTAVLTTVDILDGRQPILLVTHDADDGGWQFLPGSGVPLADARVVALKNICHRDPSVREVADLPEGWRAWRDKPAARWYRGRS